MDNGFTALLTADSGHQAEIPDMADLEPLGDDCVVAFTDIFSALPASDTIVEDGEKTITVNVTTDVAATNGLTTVSYDTSRLALESAVVNGDYTAKLEKDGKLTFGYVSLTEIPAEGTIATLTFKVLEAVESTG